MADCLGHLGVSEAPLKPLARIPIRIRDECLVWGVALAARQVLVGGNSWK